MKRRDFITLIGGAATGWPLAARAQQPGKLTTIGSLATNPSIEGQRVAAFVQRLRELGRIEGRNLAIEYRWAARLTLTSVRADTRFWSAKYQGFAGVTVSAVRQCG